MSNQPFKVIIIEDNEQMAEMISDHLQQKFPNASITKHNTGEKALSATTTEPDVIILDYQLDSGDPRALNGMQILMKLKKKFNAPVIFLSGQDKPDVSASVIKYGAYDYVVKNQQSFGKLESIINNLLSTRKSANQNVNQNMVKIVVGIVAAAIIVYVLYKMFK